MPVSNRSPIKANNHDDQYKVLVEIQAKGQKNYDTPKNYNFISVGLL